MSFSWFVPPTMAAGGRTLAPVASRATRALDKASDEVSSDRGAHRRRVMATAIR
jgi:hypothetical protein